jgi:hypothetical protein
VPSPKDDQRRALRGSETQVQLHLHDADRREALDTEVIRAVPRLRDLGAVQLDWRSPLQHSVLPDAKPFAEYRNRQMLQALQLDELWPKLDAYWPSPGPSWDALAVARRADQQAAGYILVEAKAHPEEFRDPGGGTAAKGDGLTRILDQLRATRAHYDVPETPEVEEVWRGDMYQSANRYAFLRFFRACAGDGVETFLLNLYFCNDTTYKPTARAEWGPALAQAEAELGVAGVTIEHAARGYLESGTYEELVAATGG